MQELVRKTIELIRKRPILLLPLLCVDQVVTCLESLRHLANRKIMFWTMMTRSVTGAIVPTPDAYTWARYRALVLIGPLNWASYFIHILLFVGAFVIRLALFAMQSNANHSIGVALSQ